MNTLLSEYLNIMTEDGSGSDTEEPDTAGPIINLQTSSTENTITVIVTASKETKKENLRRAITNIQNVGGKIAGVVVNKVPVSAKKYQQSYYYGSNEMMKARNDMKKAMKIYMKAFEKFNK